MNDLLERLETRIAYLERANSELSDVVYRHEQEITALRSHVAALTVRLAAERASDPQWTAEDEKPPHY